MRLLRVTAKTLFTLLDVFLGEYPGPRILIYHQIGAGHGEEMDVPRAVFLEHLEWIEASGGVVRPLAEVLEGGWQDQRQVFVLTFDDGYEDMYTGAFPVLKERGIPFTVYLTTFPTESGRPLAPERRSTPLTWDQVREMHGTGLMTLGAHTHTHVDLRELDADSMRVELDTSDRLIEERTGVKPSHFAYPWGYWSAVADPLVRERYSSAVLGGGIRVRGVEDPHLLHRIPVQLSDGVGFFPHKMKRGQRTEEVVRRLLAGYRGP